MPPIFDDADFECLRADQTAKYPLRQVHIPRGNPKPVTLVVKYAGDSNERFTKARKSSAFRSKGEDAEKAWRDAFARFVVVEWEDVLRPDGSAIPYSATACAELLERIQSTAIRKDIVDSLVIFVATADNFQAPVLEAAELGEG